MSDNTNIKKEYLKKKIIYIDMDGVIVDFGRAIEEWFETHPHLEERYKTFPDHIQGLFRIAPPIEGAISAIKKLHESGKYELFIATSAPWGNPQSNTDKRFWIEDYFGDLFHKKMFITHRKDLLMGDYLIDDRLKNGAGEFKGELLRFGLDWENNNKPNEYPTWDSILTKLL
jgi:5'-nucleotidase|tara:strand:- start:236 stop:751 length:516 start_codon:yes stop_codon:yes gene_type:complete